MNTKKFLLQSLAAGAVLTLACKVLAGKGTDAKPSPRRIANATSFHEIDAYIEAQMKRLNIPGAAVAIVEGDQIVHQRGFGRARPGGESPSPQTPFFIGSLTKSFTALAIMQLVEAGKVELDAPVQRYLSWFRLAGPQACAQPPALAPECSAGASVTVRHLLNQTSGLPQSIGLRLLADFGECPAADERQARALSKIKLNRPAGSAFEYCNTNYNLLGLIIEVASGESYADYIQSHIFDPLQMRHSYTSKAKAKKNDLAVGHRLWFWSPFAAPDLKIPPASLSAGQLISSTEDMAHYLIAYLNGGRYGNVQILSSAGINELQRGAAEFREMGVSLGRYGMGWFISDSGQTRIVWHAGCVPDFTAYMVLLPEQKKGLILLVNAGHFMMNPVQTELGMNVAHLLAGQRPAPAPFGFSRFSRWIMRLLLLIPLLQIVGVATTLRQIRRWRQEPQGRPRRERLWGQHILLPLIPNLALVAISLWMLVSKMLGFMLLFLQDFTWLALICGGFAGIWSFIRTGLIIGSMRKSQTPISVR